MRLDDLLKEYGETLTAPVADFSAILADSRRRRRQRWMVGLVGLAAAACACWMLLAPRAPRRVEEQNIAPIAAASTPVAAKTVPAAGRRPARARRPIAREETDFVALAETSMLPKPQTYQVVRVSVSGERLFALGVLRPNQSIQPRMVADVLLGDDGIARAVRVMANEY
jgi:hypothetical protein